MPEAGGVTVKDVSSHDFVIAYAAHLKRIGKIEVPKWADLVKTSVHKELAPYDPDWYYIRAAAIARRVYLRNGIGVGAFKRIFGGRRMRGTIPERFQSSSGSIARHILKEVRCSPLPADSAPVARRGEEGPVPRHERPGRHHLRARGHAPHAPGGSFLACCPTSTPPAAATVHQCFWKIRRARGLRSAGPDLRLRARRCTPPLAPLTAGVSPPPSRPRSSRS